MDRIQEMLGRLAELSDDEISELNGLIISEFETLEAQENPTEETVDQMTSLANALETVKAEGTSREETRAVLAQKAADASARVHGSKDESVDADSEEPVEDIPAEEVVVEDEEVPVAAAAETAVEEPTAAAPPEPAAAEAVVEEAEAIVEEAATTPPAEPVVAETPAPAAPETVPEPEAPAAESDQKDPVATEPVSEEAQDQQESIESNESTQEAPVTASADGQEVVVQAPGDALPVPRETAAVAITAGADIPGTGAGSSLRDMDEVADIFTKRLHALRNVNGGDGEQSIVASIALDYPEDRVLSASDGAENWNKIQAVVSEQAITAAGGYCAPLENRYDFFGLGSTDRPVKSALPGFRADRGGVRYTTPPVLSGFSGAVGLWTAATDASPGTATKPCLTVTCGNELTATADAVTMCLQFGNLMSRAYPELVARNNELASIQHARYAELQLLAKIKTGGTAITAPKNLGAARDLLDQVSRAASSIRYRHRLADTASLRVLIPSWMRDAFRSDISQQMPGDADDQHALADARIARWFSSRSINVTWTMEGLPAYGGPGEGTTTVLASYPATVEWDIFPEGTFLFLDGGTLDIGIIRDSTLVGTNDYKEFMETFEGVAKIGPESVHVTSTFAATGEAQALVDTVA